MQNSICNSEGATRQRGEAEGFKMRQATLDDVVDVKKIADQHRHALGFLPKPVFSDSVKRHSLLVAVSEGHLVGFVRYNHRKRGTETAIYDICVADDYKRQGIGRGLVESLIDECRKNDRVSIMLRCPEDLPANQFYERIGFENNGVEMGRRRKLVTWRLRFEADCHEPSRK